MELWIPYSGRLSKTAKRLSNNSNLGSLFFMFANNITISRYL